MKKNVMRKCGWMAAVAAVCLLPCVAGADASMPEGMAKKPRIVMNVVNFVRNLHHSHSHEWMVEALREEVALNVKYKLKNTILFQYDALIPVRAAGGRRMGGGLQRAEGVGA